MNQGVHWRERRGAPALPPPPPCTLSMSPERVGFPLPARSKSDTFKGGSHPVLPMYLAGAPLLLVVASESFPAAIKPSSGAFVTTALAHRMPSRPESRASTLCTASQPGCPHRTQLLGRGGRLPRLIVDRGYNVSQRGNLSAIRNPRCTKLSALAERCYRDVVAECTCSSAFVCRFRSQQSVVKYCTIAVYVALLCRWLCVVQQTWFASCTPVTKPHHK